MNNQSQQKQEAVETIQRKLLGRKLNYKEIYNLMDQISHHRVSNILTTYFVAASFKEGFSTNELFYLTKAMVETGTKLNFEGIVADKHSIGGLPGTRTTMIIVPIIAAAGFTIPKTSSRAITSPAGTADVMECFSKVTFSTNEIKKIVTQVGGCIVWGGHLGIAPADDIIIRVEEPLSFESFDKVVLSIMAKKIAVSTNHLIIDIPVGKTMKVHHLTDAEKIGKKFISLGERFGIKVIIDINRTEEPAGSGIGPILEGIDVLKVLEQKKDRPLALEERSLNLAGKLLDICYQDAKINKNGLKEAKKLLQNKSALKKFHEIIKAQNGNNQINSESIKIKSKLTEINAEITGKIKRLNIHNLSLISKLLGAPNDKFAGIFLKKRINDKIEKHEPILTFYSNNSYNLKEAKITLKNFPIYSYE